MNEILKVSDLTKRYDKFALEGISLDLPAGYIMGLIGENGAGKTTLIRSILGMTAVDSGSARILGQPVTSQALEQVGVVFDQSNLVEEWKVSEAEKAVGRFYSRWDHETFGRCLDRFGISPQKRVKELSRGMQTKLSLSLALAHDARLLILDEPTSGLDPASRDELMGLLSEYILDGERSVLFSTHITADLERGADFITYLHRGKLLYTGPKDELMESFLLVRGGREDFPEGGKVIGLRPYGGGYEGLIRAEDEGLLSPSALRERVSLDQIMVFVGKEEL